MNATAEGGAAALPPPLLELRERARARRDRMAIAARKREERGAAGSWLALCDAARESLGELLWPCADLSAARLAFDGNPPLMRFTLALPGHWPIQAAFRRDGFRWERARAVDSDLIRPVDAHAGAEGMWLVVRRAGPQGADYACAVELGAALLLAEMTPEETQEEAARAAAAT